MPTSPAALGQVCGPGVGRDRKRHLLPLWLIKHALPSVEGSPSRSGSPGGPPPSCCGELPCTCAQQHLLDVGGLKLAHSHIHCAAEVKPLVTDKLTQAKALDDPARHRREASKRAARAASDNCPNRKRHPLATREDRTDVCSLSDLARRLYNSVTT